ncbi:hypothetical protein BGX24_006525, partial [Mortierella sp. AD032]
MKIVRESKDESLEGPEQVTTAFAEMNCIFQEKQEILANATDELACLGRKTTILMSQNRFSIPGQPDHLRKREVPLFNLRGSLVPSSFTPRNDISPTIPVARLPGTLEDLVNSTPKGMDDRWTRDVQDLFSYHHLSYIYSRYLSPRGAHKKSDEDHPLWSELADELDARPGLDCLEQGWTDGDPHPMAGLDEAKKVKTDKRTGRDWGREGSRTGISQEDARKRLVDIEEDLQELESLQEEKRQKWLKADQQRYELSVHERELTAARRQQDVSEKKVKAPRTAQQQQAYQNLSQARRTAEILFLDWLKDDSRLRDLRATQYAFQKIAKTRPNTSLPNSTPHPTQPTWTNPCAENKTESIRVDHLLQGVANAESSSSTPRGIALTSDDPGLCTLNTYATTTLSNVTRAIRQYSVTTSNRFELLSVVDDIVDQKPHEEQERDLAVLPPTYTVTAPLLDDLTLSRRNQKKREKKLATDTPNTIATRAAHAELSRNSINTALTLDAIDSAQGVRRGARQTC